MTFPDFPQRAFIERIRAVLPRRVPVFLVGGGVRDILLGQSSHDLDFVLSGEAMEIGRKVANALGAAFYPMDEQRETARVILTETDGHRQILDFSVMRGLDLESDLRARDFTVNAIAMSIYDLGRLIDPLNGAEDLRASLLRACSPTAFQDDPVRILRAVRQAIAFNLLIHSNTARELRQAVPELSRVSPERLRDELFRILSGSTPEAALRTLDMFGAIPYVLPEMEALKGLSQSPPHSEPVWEHTLHVVQNLGRVQRALGWPYDEATAANLAFGQLSLRLGRFRQGIQAHMSKNFTPDRSASALAFLAALYHDSGKAGTRSLDAAGRIRFFEHEALSARLVAQRARRLRLSNEEIERLKLTVLHHMRPLWLAQDGRLPTRRAVYRFFRECGEAGVDVCLLSLADMLATYGPVLPQDQWANQLEGVRILLEAWYEQPEESVTPPPVVNGYDLMETFGLLPGPQIGILLEMIREAQATGLVNDREQALALARQRLFELEQPNQRQSPGTVS